MTNYKSQKVLDFLKCQAVDSTPPAYNVTILDLYQCPGFRMIKQTVSVNWFLSLFIFFLLSLFELNIHLKLLIKAKRRTARPFLHRAIMASPNTVPPI